MPKGPDLDFLAAVDAYKPTTLAGRRTYAWHKYIPHTPWPKQKQFLDLETPEALFGGAAGPGKSDALLMDALRDVETPGYSALLLRRTHRDLALPGGLIPRSHEWLARTDAHWDGVQKEWRFPSGAVVAFGYIDTEGDQYRYQSSAYQFIGWDELTHFPETWYQYLFSRLRRTADMDVPLRVRAATNPGGVGHDWVKARFVEPLSAERPFIAALAKDNPSLDLESYKVSLSRLDAVTRRQLEEGSWVQDASGLLYPEFNPTVHAIDAAPEGKYQTVLGLDFGVVDANAITLIGWRPHDTTTYILKSYQLHGLPDVVARDVLELSKAWEPHRIVGDVGGLGKTFAEEMRQRYGIPVVPAQKNDKLGYIRLLNGALGRGAIRVVRPYCADLIKQWGSLPKNAKGQEIPGFENHAADSALYAFRESLSYTEEPDVKTRVAVGTEEYWRDVETAMMDRVDRETERRARIDDEWGHHDKY